MVRVPRLELGAFRLGGGCSIHLSYTRLGLTVDDRLRTTDYRLQTTDYRLQVQDKRLTAKVVGVYSLHSSLLRL